MFYINVNIFILSILILIQITLSVVCLCVCDHKCWSRIMTYTKTADTESRIFNSWMNRVLSSNELLL